MGTQPVSVTGGMGGITAHSDEMRAVGRQFGGAATESLGAAWTMHGYLVHPDVLGSALLDPGGFAAFEGDLLSALDGAHGLAWVGARCGLVDGELRLAASAYESVDHLVGSLHDGVLGALSAPRALIAAEATLIGTGSLTRSAQAAVTADPESADSIIDALGIPGIVVGLAAVLPDGHGVATSTDTGAGVAGVATTPPRQLTDIVRDLDDRNGDTHHGAIDVRIMTMPNGARRVIVDITGTKSWSPGRTADITSLTTNGRALVGERTAYEQGVLRAMRIAGVRPGDDVMLVGHSEGGMIAVTTARDARASGEFTITHVITAGSPIGRTVGQLPSSVKVLALENTSDVVPHLDGAANPDRPNITTARSTHGDGTIVDDHSLHDAYVPAAADVQASGNSSIKDFLHGADGYFRATSVVTHSYQITRHY